jgi:membrane protease subunit HflK
MWLLGAIGVLSAWLLSTSIHFLGPNESGIVTTLGRYAGTIGPGFNLSMPWPLQHVVTHEAGKEEPLLLPDKDTETLMLTRDGQLIDVRAQVRWKVSDLRAFTFGFNDSEAALRRLADSMVRTGVAEQTFDELRQGRNRAELQQRIAGRMQRVLDGWHTGVTLGSVELTATNAPAQLAETFHKIDKANDDARKNHDAAVTYAARIRSKAETETAAFDKAYGLYRIAPAVTRERIYYETVEQVLQNNPVVIGGSGAGVPPTPLDDKAAAKPEGQ